MRYRLHATFADGYQYFANKQDVSVFDETRNCFWDILNPLPELHGPCVKICLFKKGISTKHLGFAVCSLEAGVPIGAIPAYEVQRNSSMNTGTGEQKEWDSAFRIGYEKNGKRKLLEIT